MKKFTFKWLLLSFILSIASVNQVWAYTATFRCVPALIFDTWNEGSDRCKVKYDMYESGSGVDADYRTLTMSWNGLMYESDGNLYRIYEVTDAELPENGVKWLHFERWDSGDNWKKNSAQYDSWMSPSSAWSLRLFRGSWDWPACEYGDNYQRWDISAGKTVVWDAGKQKWPAAQIYYYNKDDSDADDLTQLGTTQQFHKTYITAWEGLGTSGKGYGGFQFRQNSSWTAKTSEINTDLSSDITLFAHSGSYGGDGASNWQKVSPAYKGTSGATVYFDNTDAEFEDPYIKWGSDWYNRSGDMEVVAGTDGKLYKYTFPHDVYYGEFIVSDGYGYTNDYYCTEDHCTYYTALQNANVSTATTLIPSGKSAGVSTTVLDGYTRSVTITPPSHGTITVAYTDINNVSQSETVTCAVQQAAVVTISSTPATGYNRNTLTIDGESHTSGNTYPVRSNIAVAASFTPMSCPVTFDREGGTGGADGTTATYDADMTTVTIPHKIGYKFAGYYDNAEYSGTKYYDEDGHSAHLWDKDTETTTNLYAKWVPDNKTFKADAASKVWTNDANWTGGAPSNDYSSVAINGEVELSSSVHIGQLSFGDGGKLTISAGATLEVAGAITNSDESKILIESDKDGQGALILNNSSSAKATVKIYAKVASHASFQCVAIPFTSISVSNSFSGSDVYTYVWHEGTGWERRGYYTDLSEFEGIALMQTGVHTYTVSGTLVSTSNKTHTLNYSSGTYVGTNMFGNSWTAPIKIAAIEFADGAEQTVYICENGSWKGYPKGSAGETVIPAMQAYTVLATKASSITVKYKETVRDAVSHTAPLQAPKHNTTDEMTEVKLFVSDGERKTDLRLFENEQFTNSFDNGWEARYIEGDGLSGQLYAQTDDRMTVLASPDLEGTVVGFIPGEATNYTISFEGDGEGYYLNDVKKEESTLIAEGNTYEFEADEATNATRFVVSKMPMKPTGVDEVADSSKARKQMIDGTLYIIRDGRIYDATGSLVK